MKKNFFVIYVTVDGVSYTHFTIPAKSFSYAYKSAKMFANETGLTLMAIFEEQTFKDNCQILNY